MKNVTAGSKHLLFNKRTLLLSMASILFIGGSLSVHSAKAAPGFKVLGTTISPFVSASYARVVYGNMPNFEKLVEDSFSPTALDWKSDTYDKSADAVQLDAGLQIGKYFSISTGGSNITETRFNGTFENTGNQNDATSKFTYNTHFYQIAKLMLGYPLLSNNYYPFISLSANYEKLNAKYLEKDITSNPNTSIDGKNSARAVLPGIGLGLLVHMPKTDNHLSLKFEYEFIRGKNASRHVNLTDAIRIQLFNRFASRSQFLMGLRYTI